MRGFDMKREQLVQSAATMKPLGLRGQLSTKHRD